MGLRLELLKENKLLHDRILEKDKKIIELQHKLSMQPVRVDTNIDLNLKYFDLMCKYKKLLNSSLSEDTKHISYNGKLFGINALSYRKEADGVDTLVVEATEIRKETGLINNLDNAFRETAKELNKLFFGSEN